MANSQFITKLQRELKRNTKKTAILAVGLVVAAYFWAPLLAEWFGSDDKKPTKPTSAAVTPAKPQTVAETGPSAASVPEELDWESMLDWIQEDPHMISSQIEQQQRNPFESIPEELADDLEFATAEPIEEVEEIVPVQLSTPQSAGLELTGTIVTGGEGWAHISGAMYRPGEIMYVGEVDENDPTALAAQVAFTVEEIHTTYVVLSREGESYELEMAGRETPGGIHIKFAEMDTSGD